MWLRTEIERQNRERVAEKRGMEKFSEELAEEVRFQSENLEREREREREREVVK